jgi:hypothetical protein
MKQIILIVIHSIFYSTTIFLYIRFIRDEYFWKHEKLDNMPQKSLDELEVNENIHKNQKLS